jgi:hypothetical protein
MGTPPKAPKLKALARNSRIALTIDDSNFPHKVLLIRGTTRLEPLTGNRPRIRHRCRALFRTGEGKAWVAQMGKYDLVHGPHHHHARLGRVAGFPDALSQCSPALGSATYLICAVCEATASHSPLRFTKTSVHT